MHVGDWAPVPKCFLKTGSVLRSGLVFWVWNGTTGPA